MNYYVSDLHLFCKNQLKDGNFDKRPFNTIEEMHEVIKNNWNSTITNADHVYILGDISRRGYDESTIAFLSQLRGQLHLIKGNHDDISDARLKRLFCEICDYKKISDSINGVSHEVVVSHYPILAWESQHKGAVHLYGHCHKTHDHEFFQKCVAEMNKWYQVRDGEKYKPFYAVNVGIMMPYMDWRPKTLKEILDANGIEM